jgi:hypothetical protein
MIKTFTPNDVLKAQSGELPAEEKAALDATLSESDDLESFSEAAEELKSEMKSILSEPGDQPLKNIMAFVQKDLEARKKA